MSARDEFLKICEELCAPQGWNFSPKRIEAQLHDGRHQDVFLDFFDFEGEELVRLYTIVGSIRNIVPLKLTEALRLNFGLPHGAMAVKGEDLVIIDTLMVDDADAAEIEASVGYLAETGDHLEQTMFGTDEH